MASYYNEIDPFAAAWLRELIKEGLIANGEVDERSIEDVQPDDLRGFTQCHFFAGIGVWSYSLRCAGWPDDRPVWTGSCPCPSFSAAGKGQGFNDPRHLWPHWHRLIRECRPATIFGEQVDAAIGYGWLDLVQSDLEAAEYAVGKAVLTAAGAGAPHERKRLYWVASMPNSNSVRPQGKRECKGWAWPIEQFERLVQDSLRVAVPAGKYRSLAHGVANRMGLLRGAGNAIVAPVAENFIRTYMES